MEWLNKELDSVKINVNGRNIPIKMKYLLLIGGLLGLVILL